MNSPDHLPTSKLPDGEEKTPIVAVFGALGHTGQFVVSELLRRGIKPIAIARDPAALMSAPFPYATVERRIASIGNPSSIDHAIFEADAVINCAGPFVDTAEAVAEAAVRGKKHYLDVCAEQQAVATTLEKLHEPARQAGVIVIPSMAFYGGLSDLMATAAMDDWDSVDSIDIMIGLDSWHPTSGTRITIERIGTPVVLAEGNLVSVPSETGRSIWNFGARLGKQTLVQVPFSEMMLIPRHIRVNNIRTYLSSVAVRDIQDSQTPEPKAADESGRSEQRFVVEIEVTRNGEIRRSIMEGRDIYGVSAPLICEAAQRLVTRDFSMSGTFAPSEVFDAKDFLSALRTEESRFQVQV